MYVRRMLAIFGVFLLAPAAAAASSTAPGDGTLSIKRGVGVVRLEIDRGAVIGRIGNGVLTVSNPRNGDCEKLLVWEQGERVAVSDERETRRGDLECIYTGRAMRFRIVGGAPQLKLTGKDISVSAVGRGVAYLQGDLTVLEAGTYSVDGDDHLPLPILRKRVLLGDGPVQPSAG
jgi:hypothetical protein